MKKEVAELKKRIPITPHEKMVRESREKWRLDQEEAYYKRMKGE